jgi:inner membrane protein
MFNSTHTLVGLAIARTGLDRWVPYATATALIATNLPDIEIITGLASTPTYIEYHRGITHTFIGIPILSLALALGMYIFSENFWKTFLVALAVMATHPALDYANTYGLRPFLPFNQIWYYGDTLFIIDPYIDLMLLAGFLVGYRLSRIRRLSAWVSILLVLVYIGIRIDLHAEARDQLASYTSALPGVESSAVFPQMANPRLWDGIIETNEEMIKVRIDTRHGVDGELARMPKGASSEIIGHAATARSAETFIRFARFPIIRVDGIESGYRVTFIDFRFYNETTGTAFAAEVLLDQSLRVIKDSLGFNKPVNQ